MQTLPTRLLLLLACVSALAWVALWMREKGLRPLREVSAFLGSQSLPGRVVLCAFCAALWLFAGEKPEGTNSPPAQMQSPAPLPPAPPLPPAQTQSPAPAGFAPPSNAVACADWLAFGGYEDWACVPSGSWCFRFGTNFAERIVAFSSGEFRLVAGDASNRVSLLGLPVSIAPAANWSLLPDGRESLFWHAETPSNTLLLTWRDALLLRDAAKPVGVQAELHPDGAIDLRYDFSALADAAALSNAAATVWRGGAAESASLLTGQVAAVSFPAPDAPETDGLEAVFSRIAQGCSNAYYFADVAVSKGPAVVRVEGDGASYLGGYSFVANPGETNAIPLLIGVKYRVSSEAAFSAFEPLAAGAVASNVADRVVEVEWPVSFSLDLEDETGEAFVYRLAVEPDFLGGTVSWAGAAPPMRGGSSGGGSCSCGCAAYSNDVVRVSKSCACSSCMVEGEYEYEGHSEPFSFDHKDLPPGDPDPGDPEEPDPDEPEDGPSLSISFSKDVVLVEDAYESSPGVTHGRRSTETLLRIELSGNRYGGMLSLSSQNLGKLENASGGSVQLDSVTYLAPEASYLREYVCKGVSASGEEGDVVVAGSFAENLPGGTAAGGLASATVVHVKVKAQDTAPQNDRWQRHEYGVCERVVLQHAPQTAGVTWRVAGGGSVADGNQNNPYKLLICPSVGGSVSAIATSGGAELAIPLTIVEPSGISAEVSGLEYGGCLENEAGKIGMLLDLTLLPMTVRFCGIQVREVPTQQGAHTGYFNVFIWSNCWYHSEAMGAGVWSASDEDNCYTQDRASLQEVCPQPWSNGVLSWVIPSAWKPPADFAPAQAERTFFTCNQTFTMTPAGTVSVNKHGHEVSRMTNGVVVLDGVQLQ